MESIRMTIWDAYCDAGWRAGFHRLLCAKGMPAKEAGEIMYMFSEYVSRIKGTIFSSELAQINDRKEFAQKLDDIFQNKWKNHMKDSYRVIPAYFKDYLSYLDGAQAVHGIFFNDEEKERFDIENPDFPQKELTKYETDFMKDGKLVSLQNPALLSMLRYVLQKGDVSLTAIPRYCKNYYLQTIPSMKVSDFKPLIADIWDTAKVARRGKRDNKFEITYPDGVVEIMPTRDALKTVILYYGFQEVKLKRLKIRGNDLVVSMCPYGKEKNYEEIPGIGFFNVDGDVTDRRNMLNTINSIFGRKLKITLV